MRAVPIRARLFGEKFIDVSQTLEHTFADAEFFAQIAPGVLLDREADDKKSHDGFFEPPETTEIYFPSLDLAGAAPGDFEPDANTSVAASFA